MVNWKDYRDQSKTDLDAATSLYQSGDYGNAAYHLQQAVEKYAKGILYMGKIYRFPLMTHIPLEKFADQLVPAFDKIDKIARKYKVAVEKITYTETQRKYMYQCKRMMKRLKNKEVKVAVWKNSLGIPLNRREHRLFESYHFFKTYHKFSLNRLVAYSTSEKEGDRFMKEVNNDPEIKKLHYQRTVGELGRLMVATFPHEDIGRYPRIIWIGRRRENSTDLYKQHKDALWQLIETATAVLRY